MIAYIYKAKRGVDEIIEGRIMAENDDDAIERINRMNLLPIDIHPQDGTGLAVSNKWKSPFRGHVQNRDIMQFYLQTARLLKSGLPLLQALQVLEGQTANPAMRKCLAVTVSHVREGNPLSHALSGFRDSFSDLDVAIIRTGEGAGNLAPALARLTEYRKMMEKIQSRVRQALVYPAVVVAVGLATVLFMMIVIIPKFAVFFQDLGQELPYSTRILISISNWLNGSGLFIMGAGIVIFSYWWCAMKKATKKNMRDSLLAQLPLVRYLIIRLEMIRFLRSLNYLLQSGSSLTSSVRLSMETISNLKLQLQMKEKYCVLEEGGSLSHMLAQIVWIPDQVRSVMKIAEKSGKLEQALNELSEWYEEETDEDIEKFIKLLEPILILVLGGILSIIISALLMPVFSLSLNPN